MDQCQNVAGCQMPGDSPMTPRECGCDVPGCNRSCIATHNHAKRFGTAIYGGCKCVVHVKELKS